MDREYLLSLVEKYDSPLYVYDAEKIKEQYKRITSAFSNVNILKLFKSFNAGLDTVSVQEVQLGLKAGFDPQDIIFTPNGVSLEEIEQAMNLGVHINIDNIS